MTIDNVLSAHVGSPPRDEDVVRMPVACENGQGRDFALFDAIVQAAVDASVRRKVAAGIDLVSEGGPSNIGYAVHVGDGLSGFDGDSPRQIALDLQPLPELR